MNSSTIVHLVLFGWAIIGIALFAALKPARALALVYVIGILALPQPNLTNTHALGMVYITYSLRLDKFTACNLAVLLGTLLFHLDLLMSYRFDWLDLALPVAVVSAYVTGLVNHLGAHNATANATTIFTRYAPILFFAKIYITEFADLMEVIRALIGGAFVYAILGLYEWRMSPVFHLYLYGYYQHGFQALERWGHYRPTMMMKNALQYAFFMGAMTVCVFWLWRKKLLKPLWGVISAPVVFAVVLIGLLCSMTYGGYFVGIMGVGFYFLYDRFPRRWWLAVLPTGAMAWMYGRYAEVIHTPLVVDVVRFISTTRAWSLRYRFKAEDQYIGIAHQSLTSMLFGVGGFGRMFGRHMTYSVDSFWLIISASSGLVGLTARLLMWATGIVAAWRLWPRVPLGARPVVVVIALILGLNLVDCCVNANTNPLFLIPAFGLLAIAHRAARETRASRVGVRAMRTVHAPAAQVRVPAPTVAE